MSRYDTIVIGAGLAGLTAACRLTQAKKKVLLIGHGLGSLLLASGCIDVLGFQPATATEPVMSPLSRLDDFIADHKEHPYQTLGKKNIEAGVQKFKELVGNYQGNVDRNWLLPSTAGAVHPTCLAPQALANGDLTEGGSLLIVGFKELRDFYPAFISTNLNEQDLGVTASSVVIEAPPPLTGNMDVTPIELARGFDQPDFRQQVVQRIKQKQAKADRIGFPAVLGLKQHADALADLEKQLGATVFEISTLPPSVPGRRLFEQLRQQFTAAGGQIIIGSRVVDGEIAEGKVTHIRYQTSNRLRKISAPNYVLATGGIFGGGVQTNQDGEVWEPIFGLPIEHSTNRHLWFDKKFIAPKGQPVAQYGLKVDNDLHPLNGSKKAMADNLYVIGSLIAGSDWIQGRTGDGVAIATAARASELVLS